MFLKFMRFALVRSIVFPLGLTMYIYTAVNHATEMRAAQNTAAGLSDTIAGWLPDEYAVWVPSLNLETTLLALGFTLIAFVLVEVSLACCRIAFSKIRKA